MIVVGICLVVALFGGGVAITSAIVRRKTLAAVKKPLALTSGSAELEEWKKIFRDTVISMDGQLSPEMEAYLMHDDARVEAFLAKARAWTEKDRAEILKKTEQERLAILRKAEEQRAELLGENEEHPSSRPLLMGGARKEYDADMAACTTPLERGSVIHRWHDKGFRFPRAMRAELMQAASNEQTRAGWREMFDEQDEVEAPAEPKKKKGGKKQ